MSKKSGKIAALIQGLEGQLMDAHYLGYFECFNQGLYYEAHDVLEELWLADRKGPNYAFYKGLIQLAGAFVHLQKARLKPSLALFKLAETNLRKYGSPHESLNISETLGLIHLWSNALVTSDFKINPLRQQPPPRLHLMVPVPTNNGCIIIATRNRHKLAEIERILGGDWRCMSMMDFPGAPEVNEDKNTFAGNAQKKSMELGQWLITTPNAFPGLKFPLLILADDSGLEVDALDGAPGVFSARFAAMETGAPGNSPDSENNAKLLRLLAEVPPRKRSARFRCVIALTRIDSPKIQENQWRIEMFEGSCEGRIAEQPSGGGGFGYDPLFIPSGHDVSFAELGEEEKNKISHRSAALAKLKKALAEAVKR